MSFLVNEDSTGSATIHLSDCQHIVFGKRDKGNNGRWYGPFDFYGEAKACASKTGKRVKDCGGCLG